MCGRYACFESEKDLIDRYEALPSEIKRFEPSYNIVPDSFNPVITRQSPNQVILMKWGLIPHWAKDPKIGRKMINARSETVAEKPAFRGPFAKRRCIVPANGFYEWKKTDKGKVPYYITLKKEKIISMAGIYDIWKDAEGFETISYSILTTAPNSLIEPIHNRMPVILKREDEDMWLDSKTKPQDLKKLLKSLKSDLFEAYAVSKMVNNPANDSADLIKKTG